MSRSATKVDWLLRMGLIVVVIFVINLAFTFISILIGWNRADDFLKLLEVLMGWEELLGVVLAGVVAVLQPELKGYLTALAAKARFGTGD